MAGRPEGGVSPAESRVEITANTAKGPRANPFARCLMDQSTNESALIEGRYADPRGCMAPGFCIRFCTTLADVTFESVKVSSTPCTL